MLTDGISDIVVTNVAGDAIAVLLVRTNGTYEKSSGSMDPLDKHAAVAQMTNEGKF